MMRVWEFFRKYYLEPLGKYYTLPATLTYALLFILATYLAYKLLKKLKIKFTERFFYSLIPFVLLGGVIRALRDAEIIYKGPLFVSPPIYFLIFSLTLFCILLAKAVEKRFGFEKTLLLLGITILIPNLLLALLAIKNIVTLFKILFLWCTFSLLPFLFYKLKIISSTGASAISAQLLDACSASYSIALLGYGEQHVVSSIIISINPWLFIPVKLLVASLCIVLIEKHAKAEERLYLEFLIFMLGLALGTRNTLRASMAV